MRLNGPDLDHAGGRSRPLLLETWGMVAGAAIGAVASGVSANQANKKAQGAANAANKQAGYVDVTTTRKGDPMADGYRNDGMQAAYNTLFGTDYRGGDGQQLRVQGAPGGPAGGASQNMTPKQAKQYKAEQERIAAAKGKKGATAPTATGGKTAAPRKFDGMSGETDAIRDAAMALPGQNAAMNKVAEGFVTDTLGGTERNAYRGEAADAARAIADDPELAAYQAEMRRSLGVGGDGGGATGRTGGASRGRGSTSYVQPDWASPSAASGASATGTDKALRDLVAGELPAGWQGMEDAIARRVNEGRAGNIRELRARAVGSGFYGGDVYKDLESGAIAKGDQEMADSLSAARFGAFQNALGLGTQYDLGMAGISASDRASARSAGAASAAADADRTSRERLAMYGMWGDSIGMGQQGRTASAGALGDLAGLTSADQLAALEGVNALAGSRRGDVGLAGEISLGADSNRNAFTSAQRSERVGMAGVNLGRQELGFAREQMYDPLNRLGQYAGLLNTFYGGLGSETTSGRDMRSGAPAAFQPGSVGGAAASGAALGAQIGSAYQRRPSQGSQPPPPSMVSSH